MSVFTGVRLRGLPDDVRILLHPIVYWATIIFIVIAMIAQFLNILGFGLQPQFASYFLGLVLLLLIGSIHFARILFARPESPCAGSLPGLGLCLLGGGSGLWLYGWRLRG